MKIQTEKQVIGEGPQEFEDRCRKLEQVMCKVNNPVTQRIHRENAAGMCLGSFVSGLAGTAGRQVRFANPQSLQQPLTIALAVTEVERQEKAIEIFFSGSDKPTDPKDRGNEKSKLIYDAHSRRGTGRAQKGLNMSCYE
jgi:hypothetical protein